MGQFFSDEELEEALSWIEQWEGEVRTAGESAGIPRCLLFPGREPCCGRTDIDGDAPCPPPAAAALDQLL